MRTIPEPEEGTHRAKASGTLPNGKPVVVNADGTVSVVSETSVSQAIGSADVFVSGAPAGVPAAAFDSNSNRVVIAYQGPNPYSGFAVVGTISGTSISFGTPVVFKTNSGNISIAFDSSNNKIVIAYLFGDDSKGYAIVGTVSNTTISFGTPVEFEAGNMGGGTSVFVNSNKVVISYRDRGNSSYGTAIVGTVSGTGISFGSATVFESAAISGNEYPSSTNVTGTDKVVVAYRDGGNSNAGTAIVGTVSGTGISFGSATVFQSAAGSPQPEITFDSSANRAVIFFAKNDGLGYGIVGTVSGTGISFGTAVKFSTGGSESYVDKLSCVFDSNAGKVVVAYRFAGNSNYGTLTPGTVSGTTISFESNVTFESALTTNITTTFDNVTNKVIVAYTDQGNSSYGTGIVFQNSSTSTTLTSENYIGISKGGAYASGSSATVDIIGSVSENQSSLTAGQSYFVQTDGTIGLTADDPSVFAGTAVSATNLLVKV